MTPLDIAHEIMAVRPDDDAARLRFYERLADGELFLLLEAEPDGTTISPQVFPLDTGPVVLAFDLEERLVDFTGATSAYAALPGRVIAAQLAGLGVGLGVNFGVAPSSMLLPPEAVSWLAQTIQNAPEEVEARPVQFHPPATLPERLVEGVLAKLARAGGLADHALLAAVGYDDGRRGHMLAFVDARPGAEEPLARAMAEALVFSGIDQGEVDVAFLAAIDPLVLRMTSVAKRFDLPKPVAAEVSTPAAPGMNPDKPPILR